MIIYKATNLVNGKVYIGLTTRTLKERITQHVSDAVNSRTNMIFHKAIRKYGRDNFIWEVVDTATTEDELKDKEIFWISFYNSRSDGYNITFGGEGTSGYKHSEEVRKKMSEIAKKEGLKGSKIGTSKLNENDALEIKELIKQGISLSEIANRFNVKKETISNIKCGKAWAHIGEDLSHIVYWKLTEDDVLKIKDLIKKEIPLIDIAKNFNVSPSAINSVKRGTSWMNVGEDVSNIKYSNITHSKLNKRDVLQIKDLIKSGKALTDIATQFHVEVVTISSIKNGRIWNDVGEDISYIKYSNSLTEDAVIKIKTLLKEGKLNHREIGELFEVSRETISAIKMGKTWSHVGENLSGIKYYLTENDVREIKILLKEENLTQKGIAKMFNVDPSTISAIKRGKHWVHVQI